VLSFKKLDVYRRSIEHLAQRLVTAIVEMLTKMCRFGRPSNA